MDADALARGAFVLLCAAFAIGFVVYPTYPNYDSYYSLLWGREVLDLSKPVFEGFRFPTEHPLAIVAGTLLALLGDGADRVWIAGILASFLWLVWGIWRLGRESFTPLIGAIAAVLLLTRFDFAFLAARGYIDIPYMGLVVWAVVLEARRPRRGTSVLVLLALAGLLRPEGWLMAAAYWLWLFPQASWGDRVRYAVLAAIAPVVWFLTDFVVTGDPLFSLTYTSGSAEDLGRSRSLREIPGTLPEFFSSIVKLPVLVAALAGLVFAVCATPRRAAGPLLLFAAGLGSFVAIAAAGASVIERYLTLAALALLVFAGVALGGFALLEEGRTRRVWTAAAVVLALAGTAFTITRVSLTRFEYELEFRGDSHAALVDVLRSDEVRAALRCGPLSLPNHKLVPESRWILGLPANRVVARAQRGPDPRNGAAVYVVSRFALFRQALTEDSDPATIQIPPPGWRRAVTSDFYAAYVRCESR
jgi:hypothetical protein